MSNNPWPFVVVALTSLGFLANSMAQQRSPSSQDAGNSFRFGALPSPDFDTVLSDSNRRFDDSANSAQPSSQNWNSTTTATSGTYTSTNANTNTNTVAPPPNTLTTPPNTASLGSDLRYEMPPTGSISNVRESINNALSSQTNPGVSNRSFTSEARLGTELLTEMPNTNPAASGRSAAAPAAYGNTYNSSTRVAQNSNRFGDDLQRRRGLNVPESTSAFDQELNSRLNNGGTTQPYSTVLPPPTAGPTGSTNSPLFPKETVSTSILSDPPMIRPNQSPGFGRRDTLGTRQDRRAQTPAGGSQPPSTTLPSENLRGVVRSDGELQTKKPAVDVSDDKTTKAGSQTEDKPVTTVLPFWPTMALFASLAANLFFGWFAWDTHSRYQDFVEEMSENDMRVDRQKRRMRSEPRSRDERRPRRTREQEEAEFLQGGLEV